MEHRWSLRKTAAGIVTVECPRLGIVRAFLKNVSLGGAFIETGGTALPLDAPVVLTFHARHMGEWLNGRGLNAMVIRLTADGAGLMFIDPEIETVRALRDFVHSTSAFRLAPATTRPFTLNTATSRPSDPIRLKGE
jgi:hypothetical protein